MNLCVFEVRITENLINKLIEKQSHVFYCCGEEKKFISFEQIKNIKQPFYHLGNFVCASNEMHYLETNWCNNEFTEITQNGMFFDELFSHSVNINKILTTMTIDWNEKVIPTEVFCKCVNIIENEKDCYNQYNLYNMLSEFCQNHKKWNVFKK